MHCRTKDVNTMDAYQPYSELCMRRTSSDDDEDPFACSPPCYAVDGFTYDTQQQQSFEEWINTIDISDCLGIDQPDAYKEQRNQLESILCQLRQESLESNRKSSIDYGDETTMQQEAGQSIHTQTENKVRLFEFVLQLLNENTTDCVRWLCPNEGEFEITNSTKIAHLWGQVKRNPNMTYEKFARALRHYYKLGILIHYKHKEKLRYKFSKKILLKNKMAK